MQHIGKTHGYFFYDKFRIHIFLKNKKLTRPKSKQRHYNNPRPRPARLTSTLWPSPHPTHRRRAITTPHLAAAAASSLQPIFLPLPLHRAGTGRRQWCSPLPLNPCRSRPSDQWATVATAVGLPTQERH
jgi:hypothetical protein